MFCPFHQNHELCRWESPAHAPKSPSTPLQRRDSWRFPAADGPTVVCSAVRDTAGATHEVIQHRFFFCCLSARCPDAAYRVSRQATAMIHNSIHLAELLKLPYPPEAPLPCCHSTMSNPPSCCRAHLRALKHTRSTKHSSLAPSRRPMRGSCLPYVHD